MVSTHDGKIVDQVAGFELKKQILAQNLPKITIGKRFISDCEMIAVGAFSPVDSFMTKEQALSVIESMHLPNNVLWPIPIVLPIDKKDWDSMETHDVIMLVDSTGLEIARLKVSEKYQLDLDYFCKNVFKTTDENHPGVSFVKEAGNYFLAGKIDLLNRPRRGAINEKYFVDPQEMRKLFHDKGWRSIVAFQTRNPIHRAHEYITKCALEAVDGLLIHPVVGEQNADDIPADTRMECYDLLLENYYNADHAILSALPYSMRYAGPREAILHFIIRQNYGVTHMIIGRDHAGVGEYYKTYEAQELLETVLDELHIIPMKFEHAFFCKKCDAVISHKTCPHSKEDYIHLSGTQVRAMLREGKKPPEQFCRLEIAEILMKWAQK